MARAIVTVPAAARRGDVVEVRAQIAHPMETGFRPNADGTRVPRDVLRRFACRCNGELVVEIDLYPAIAANPYLAFHLRVTEDSVLELVWTGDHGFAQTETARIAVA
jgi:sulfur-oxidizing protein SoxZ